MSKSCTSRSGHSWLFQDYIQSKRWIMEWWDVEQGDKRICLSCGLIQEHQSGHQDISFTDVGYAENKDEVIKAWEVDHNREERKLKKEARARNKKTSNNIIKTSDLILSISNKTEDQE